MTDRRVRELVTRAAVGVAQVDPGGRFLDVNDRFCEIVGRPREELVGDPPGTGKSQAEITHPRDRGAADRKLRRAAAGGEPYTVDARYRRPDGGSVWVRNTVTAAPGADGAAGSLFAVVVDVTDLARTERALRRTRDRLRLAAEAGGLGVWSFDLEKGTADWSDEALAIYGGGFDGAPTIDDLRARVFREDWEAFAADLSAGAGRPGAEPRRFDLTHRVVHPPRTGSNETDEPVVRWVRSLGEVRLGPDGRPARSLGVIRDVTEQVERDRRLDEERTRLRLAAGAAKLGMYELDLETDRLWWDDRCRAVFDFPAGGGGAGEDGAAIPLAEGMGRIHPGDAPVIAADLDAARARARVGEPAELHLAYRVVRRDGGHTHVRSDGEVRVGPWGAGGAVSARVVGFLRDVTAEVERERRLAETADRLALAADAAELGAYEVDLRAGTVWWDGRVRDWYGVPGAADTVPLEEAFACVHPDDRPAVEAAMAEAHRPGGSARFRYEYRVRDAAGAERWCRAHGAVRFAEVGGETAAVSQTGYVQDVTAEKRRAAADAAHAAELAARAAEVAAAEERRRLAATAAELGAFDFAPRAAAIWMDGPARRLFGLPDDVRDFGDALARIHPDDRPGVEEHLTATFAGDRPPRFAHEYRVCVPGRETRWVRGYAEVTFEDGPDGAREAARVVGCLQDVTDRKRAEIGLAEAKARLETENDRLEAAVADRTAELRAKSEELTEKNVQLRAAAERLGEVARQERDRIAHVLHDELQQILVGAKMYATFLERADGGEAGVAQTRAHAVTLRGLIEEAIAESRTLSAELSPPVLRTAGLAPALDWLAGQVKQRHGLAVTTDCDPAASARLPGPTADLLFNAARECLLNVVKHAAADAAAVGLTAAGPGAVELVVADGGAGFDPAAGEAAAGFGMSDLRQRVDLLGGDVTVEAAPGEGCTVRVRVPVGG